MKNKTGYFFKKRVTSIVIAFLLVLQMAAPSIVLAADEWPDSDGRYYSTSRTAWTPIVLTPQTVDGKTTVEFDVVPLGEAIDGAIGLTSSTLTATQWRNFPVAVRMYTNGYWEAFNDSGYKTSTLKYAVNTKYHVKLEIDITNKVYSAFVTPEGGQEVTIASGYAFRNNAPTITDIGKLYPLGGEAATGGAGNYYLENPVIAESVVDNTNWPDENGRYYSTALAGSSWRPVALTPKVTANNRTMLEFDVTPTMENINGIVGMTASNLAASAYGDLPIAVRMNTEGYFDAFNYNIYNRIADVAYQANTTYHIRVLVNLKTQRYDAFVTPEGGQEIQIADNFAYRNANWTVNNIAKLYPVDAGDPTTTGGAFYVEDPKVTSVGAIYSEAEGVWNAIDVAPLVSGGRSAVVFDLSSEKDIVNGLIGLTASNLTASAADDLPVRIGLSPYGYFEAYDGSVGKVSSVAYSAGQSYRVKVIADLENKTYDAFVTSWVDVTKLTNESAASAKSAITTTKIADGFSFTNTSLTVENLGRIYIADAGAPTTAGGSFYLEEISAKSSDVSYDSTTNTVVNGIFLGAAGLLTAKSVIEYDLIPSADNINGFIGLISPAKSNPSAGVYDTFSVVLQLNADGTFSALDGTTVQTGDLSYLANEKYHVQVIMDFNAQTYDAYITYPDGTVKQLADAYGFSTTGNMQVGRMFASAADADTPEAAFSVQSPIMYEPYAEMTGLDAVSIAVKDGSGTVLAEGKGELTYNGTYTRGSDTITFEAPIGAKYMMVQADEYVGIPTGSGDSYTYGESMVYAPDGKVIFTVPEKTSAYDPMAFEGETHKITARAATEEEIKQYRNLAVNPLDQRPDTNSFPHAITNSVSGSRAQYEPRNAIDGFTVGGGDGSFPYQAWKGTAAEGLEFSVLLGRTASVDKVELSLRSHADDGSWSGAVLEFSDGSELPITLQNTNDAQSFTFPEKKISWVRLKNLEAVGSGCAALSEMKVFGSDIEAAEEGLPSAQALINLTKKVNDRWIKNHLDLGNNGWANAVYYTGNMEAYYLTGDENYYNHALKWAQTHDWDLFGNNSVSDNNNPDNYTCVMTYLDLCGIDSANLESFDATKQIIDSIVNNTGGNGALTAWGWCDLLFMGMSTYTKMYLLTGEQKYLDKLHEFYLYEKNTLGLYDETEGLWYRDHNYINRVSPNGEKVLWSRGNGWVFGGLTKVLQDLPDNSPYKEEYESMFKTMAAALIKCQGEDGFWRMNLADPYHAEGPETSGTALFIYGMAWGVNSGLLDKEVYMPHIVRGFSGLNANAIHPDGLVGRVQPIGGAPDPNVNYSYSATQNYAVGEVLLMLSELSKLSGGVCGDDLQPMLNKKMIGAVGMKVNSLYAVDGNTVIPLAEAVIEKDGEIYVPVSFITAQYGVTPTEGIITENAADYVLLASAAQLVGKEVFTDGDLIVLSHKAAIFLPETERALIELLSDVLTDGVYPERPETVIRYEYEDMTDYPTGWPNPDGTYYSTAGNKESWKSVDFTPKADENNVTTVEFDATPRKSYTDGVIGLTGSDQTAVEWSNLPVMIRMSNGYWEAYDYNTYKNVNNLEYQMNEKYRVRIVVDLTNSCYDAFVTTPYNEEVQIAYSYSFRKTAPAITDIGKLYPVSGGTGSGDPGNFYVQNIMNYGVSEFSFSNNDTQVTGTYAYDLNYRTYLVAVYSADGRLIAVDSTDTATGEGPYTYTVTVELPRALADGDVVRSFLWSDAMTMIPEADKDKFEYVVNR